MTPLAHVGHWYHSLLYAVPIVLIALALWWSGRRDDRRRDAERGAVPPQAAGGSGAGEDPEAGGRA